MKPLSQAVISTSAGLMTLAFLLDGRDKAEAAAAIEHKESGAKPHRSAELKRPQCGEPRAAVRKKRTAVRSGPTALRWGEDRTAVGGGPHCGVKRTAVRSGGDRTAVGGKPHCGGGETAVRWGGKPQCGRGVPHFGTALRSLQSALRRGFAVASVADDASVAPADLPKF